MKKKKKKKKLHTGSFLEQKIWSWRPSLKRQVFDEEANLVIQEAEQVLVEESRELARRSHEVEDSSELW